MPSFDSEVDELLESLRSPWGGGGHTMRVAICGLDAKAIYRVEEVDGLGEWMTLVMGLERIGLEDSTKGTAHALFDAVFVPSGSLQAGATARQSVLPGVTEDVAAAAAQLELLTSTEREQVILARQGQGIFREALLQAFSGHCALTGVAFDPVLRASHIRPWRDSSNVQRLDVNNGLLLRADVDALFDGGHITFGPDGGLLLAASVPETVASALGIRDGMRLDSAALTPSRLEALAHHRAHVFLS